MTEAPTKVLEYGRDTPEQPFGESDQQVPGGSGTGISIDGLGQLLYRNQRAAAQVVHPYRVNPEPQRDHVFWVGPWIQVHAAKDHQKAILQRRASRPRLLREQHFADGLLDSRMLQEPAAEACVLGVQVRPEWPLVRSTCSEGIGTGSVACGFRPTSRRPPL